MEQPNFYAIIPANVRYDTRLKANEKLLYAEITALANTIGYCYASNEYFEERYNVKERAVQKWISNLKDNGYIRVEMSENNTKRKIFIADISQNINLEPPNKKTPTPEQKDTPPPVQKDTHNNTSINNKINNIFDFWNSKDIIKHQKLNDDLKNIIASAIKKYGFENIKNAIDRYSKAYFDDKFYYNNRWALANFLKQKNGITNWLDDGQIWNNYCPAPETKGTSSPSGVPSTEQTDTYLENLRKLREGGGDCGNG